VVLPPPPDDDHPRPGDATPDPCFRGETSLAVTAAAGASGGGRGRGPKPPERALLVAATVRGTARALLHLSAATPQGRAEGVRATDFASEGWQEWWSGGADPGAAASAFDPDAEEPRLYPALAALALGGKLAGLPAARTPLRPEQLRPPTGWSAKASRAAWWKGRRAEAEALPGTGHSGAELALDLTSLDASLMPAMGELSPLLEACAEEVTGAVQAAAASRRAGDPRQDASEAAAALAAGAVALAASFTLRHLLRLEPSARRAACASLAVLLAAASSAASSLPSALVGAPSSPGLARAAAAATALLDHVAHVSDRLESGRGSSLAAASLLPAPGEPRFASWVDAPVKILAEQWARLDFAAFQRVPVEELLRAGFDDPRYKHTADAVRACVDRFNAESLWAASAIVRAPTPRARAATYMRVLAVAVWLRRLRDYFGLSSLLMALRSAPVKRLHATRALLPPEAEQQEKEASKVVSENLYFMRYLKALADTPPGAAATPYLAPHTQLLLLTESTMESEFPRNWAMGHSYKTRALYEVAAPLAELREGAFDPAVDGDAATPVRSVCGIIEAALREHTFYFDEDSGVARARLLEHSRAVEPDLPPEPEPEPEPEYEYEQEGDAGQYEDEHE